MNIKDVLKLHLKDFNKLITRHPAHDSEDDEDIMQDIYLRAIKKYGDSEVDEQEASDYIMRQAIAELHYHRFRIPPNKPQLLFYENLEKVETSSFFLGF